MKQTKIWILRTIDKVTHTQCKEDRWFEGTEEEVKEYIKDRFEVNNNLLDRETVYFVKD